MTMNPDTARKVERPPIVVGNYYTFFCEVQQEYEPPAKRLRRFTGQLVCVVKSHGKPDADSSEQYEVQAKDGTEFTVHEEEINDWDRDLGQYFWPDATYGPGHDAKFLSNERDNDNEL
jgi:hypothetical protein